MKLLLINFEYPPLGGGGGVATKDIASILQQRHEVHILTTRFKGLPAYEHAQGLHIHRVSVIGRHSLPTASLISMLTFVPSALWRGFGLCRRHRFDVINAQFVVPSGVPAALLSWWFGKPFVLSFIGGDIYDPSKGLSPHRYFFLRWLIRLLSSMATSCTAISQDTKRHAQQLHGVTKPITVVPLGFAPAPVPPATRQDLHLPEGVPLFVSIGRLIPRKGYEVLLAGWREVKNAHLAIIGNGPLYNKLRDLATSYNLTERVHFLGFVEEERKQQILRVADAYISTAQHEGFGIVFLEAMEAGLPIVATDHGGQTDILTGGQHAILIPPHDPKQVTSAVTWLCRDKDLRVRLAHTNKERVKDFYLEKTVAQFEQVLLYAHRH